MARQLESTCGTRRSSAAWMKNAEYANIQPINPQEKNIKTPACLFNVRFTQYSHICTEAHSLAAFVENLRGPNRSAQRVEPALKIKNQANKNALRI